MNRIVVGKYIPLQNYLKKLTSSHVTLSFNEIETILNTILNYLTPHINIKLGG